MNHRSIAITLVATLAVLLAGCRGLRIEGPHQVSASDWPTEGDGSVRSHVAASIAPPLEERWVYNAGAGFGPLSPLIVGETVFVGTRKGEMHAIELATGQRVGYETFGESIEGTPVFNEGTLFIPSGWGRRALYAYDLRQGRQRWSLRGAPIEAGLAVAAEGLVSVDTKGSLRLHNLDDGSTRWSHSLGENVFVSATPVVVDDRLIVGDVNGHLAAFDAASGALLWTRDVGAPIYHTPSAHHGFLIVPTTRGRIVAVDVTSGAVRWNIALPDTTVRFAAPATHDSMVYVGATDGVVRALDVETGNEVWTYGIDAAIASAPLIAGDVIYVGSLGKDLLALDRVSGAQVWSQTLKGRVKSAFAAKDGALIVLAEPRYVYMFSPSARDTYAGTE